MTIIKYIFEKITISYDGIELNKIDVFKEYGKYCCDILDSPEPNKSVLLLHTGSIYYMVMLIAIISIECLCYNNTNIFEIINTLEKGDILIRNGERVRFLEIEEDRETGEKYLVLEEKNDLKRKIPLCNIDRLKSLSIYRGESQQLGGRGVRSAILKNRKEFISFFTNTPTSEISAMINKSMAILLDRETAEKIFKKTYIFYNDKRIKLNDLITASYYSENENYQIGENSYKEEAIIRFYSNISICRKDIIKDKKNRILGFIALDENLWLDNSEISDITNRNSIKITFMLGKIHYIKYTDWIKDEKNKVIAYVPEYLSQFKTEATCLTSRNFYDEINFLSERKILEFFLDIQIDEKLYYGLIQKLDKIRKDSFSSDTKDKFLFSSYFILNICRSAMLDNHLQQGNSLGIDPTRIVWHRCLDMNDRALRNVIVGLGGSVNGVPREDHFDITVASEIMAVLCLATSLEDFKRRISKIVVAYTYDKRPVTVEDIQATGAVTLIMKDALMPNLVQTLEHTPAFVHGGPFANIAHGCNSVLATRAAMSLGDYVVTEAGFGADLGAEKFFDIKCRQAEIQPSCVVIVATIRALKMHGGVLKENLKEENIDALLKGIENLEKHIENIKKYHVGYVIAINRFATDSVEEIKALEQWATSNQHPISLSDVFTLGGKGGTDLALKVLSILDEDKKQFTPLYDLNLTIKQKITKICKEIYGASAVEFSQTAKNQMAIFKRNGWDNLPVCIAKTQYSFSDNPKLLGRPKDFSVTIRELKPSIGAGFIVALSGDITTMPGLPKEPAANHMDVVDGKTIGLF